jgi:hypothetical protein
VADAAAIVEVNERSQTEVTGDHVGVTIAVEIAQHADPGACITLILTVFAVTPSAVTVTSTTPEPRSEIGGGTFTGSGPGNRPQIVNLICQVTA